MDQPFEPQNPRQYCRELFDPLKRNRSLRLYQVGRSQCSLGFFRWGVLLDGPTNFSSPSVLSRSCVSCMDKGKGKRFISETTFIKEDVKDTIKKA